MTTNFENLTDPQSPVFLQELASIDSNFPVETAKQFYEHITPFLNQTLENNIVLSIIGSVINSFEKKECISFFTQEFVNLLPFEKDFAQESIIELLYILSDVNPSIFTSEIVSKFSQLIPSFPKESLAILGKYVQHLEEIDDLWAMTDLLFYHGDSFFTNEILPDYITTLIYLCQTYSFYFKDRGVNVWNQLCQLIPSQHQNSEIMALLLDGLSRLAAVEEQKQKTQWSLPTFYLIPCVNSLYRPLSSLLLRINPIALKTISEETPYDPLSDKHLKEFIFQLLESAKENKKVLLILMEFCQTDVDIALILSENSSWLEFDLPDRLGTLRLFANVIFHAETRDKFVKNGGDQLISFLNRLISTNSRGVTVSIVSILRRLAITEEMADKLHESGFLKTFCSSVFAHNEEKSQKCLLLLFDKLAKIKYLPEMSAVSQNLFGLIKSNQPIAHMAIHVAISISNHQEGYESFQDLGLSDYMLKKMSETEWKKEAKLYLHIVKKQLRKVKN